MKKASRSKHLTQDQVDELLRQFKANRAVERRLGATPNWQRYLMSDGAIFHVSTKNGTLTITLKGGRA